MFMKVDDLLVVNGSIGALFVNYQAEKVMGPWCSQVPCIMSSWCCPSSLRPLDL